MRSIKLLPTLAAAATLLALGPAGAWASGRTAEKHSSPNGRCSVNINVVPRQITAGDSVVVFGRLRCRGRSPTGRPARRSSCSSTSSGTPGFVVAQTTTTDVRGFYEFTVAGVAEQQRLLRALARRSQRTPDRQGRRAGDPLRSAGRHAAVHRRRQQGDLHGHRHPRPTPARAWSCSARTRPPATNGTGSIWARSASDGSYSITHTFVVPGDANIRVLVRSQRRNIPSPSNVLTYEISQAQNPSLTIQASADPISYGQSVTISGTVAAGARNSRSRCWRARRASTASRRSPKCTTDGSRQLHVPGAVADQQHLLRGEGRRQGLRGAVRGRQGRAHRRRSRRPRSRPARR